MTRTLDAGAAPQSVQAVAPDYRAACKAWEAAEADFVAIEAESRARSAALYSEIEALNFRDLGICALSPEGKAVFERLRELRRQIDAENPGLAEARKRAEALAEAEVGLYTQLVGTKARSLVDLGIKAAAIARARGEGDEGLNPYDAVALLGDVLRLCPAPTIDTQARREETP